jgi:hypothetical protein
MQLAAEASSLHDHAFRYSRLARVANSVLEAYRQQSESGEGPGCPAWYAATRVVEKDPEHGWELILAMVPIASDDFMMFIAVGPIESFLKEHAESHIDRIEAWAAEDPRFRECLSMAQIFEEDCPPRARRRLEKLGVRILHSDKNRTAIEGFLRIAAGMEADRIEIEYKDGENLVTAFHGPVGVGIGRIDPSEWEGFFEEMQKLRKRIKVMLGGRPRRLAFSKYESFGNWVHVIGIEAEDRRPRRQVNRRS